MVSNQKTTGKATSIPVGILSGVTVSMLITLVGAAVAAWLISAEITSQESVGYLSAVILVLGGAIGAAVSAGRIKRMRLQMSVLSGVFYYLSLLAMTALFFGGQYEGMGATGIAVAAGCAGGAIVGLKGKTRRSGGAKKKRSR